MRRYGMQKKNPNPPWPNEQSAVVIPPGSNATSVGMPGRRVYEMNMNSEEENLNQVPNGPLTDSNASAEGYEESERNIRRDPIMGYFSQNRVPGNSVIPVGRPNRPMTTPPTAGVPCGNLGVSGYLCGQIGKYVKMEFLFGENIHMEKMGRLREVGRDFVAIQENGTNNMVICSMDKIKFINVYEYGLG